MLNESLNYCHCDSLLTKFDFKPNKKIEINLGEKRIKLIVVSTKIITNHKAKKLYTSHVHLIHLDQCVNIFTCTNFKKPCLGKVNTGTLEIKENLS